MLSSTRSTPMHGFTCSRLARIQDDTSSKQADTISEGVGVTRLTEAV